MILPPIEHLFLALVCAAGVAGIGRRARALSLSGAIAAAVIGFLLFGMGGVPGAAALLLFFVSSSLLSRWRKRDKGRLAFEKGGERDAGQVLANGGVAAVCALLLPVLGSPAWLRVALLAALAAANADTWATEIGALARRPPRLITTFQAAPAGASGAVSLPGTAAALAGALLVASVAFSFGAGAAGMAAATLGGFVGALSDSVLGATIQAQFRCSVCGAVTERTSHCGETAPLARGLPGVTNDVVNGIAVLTGSVAGAALFNLFR